MEAEEEDEELPTEAPMALKSETPLPLAKRSMLSKAHRMWYADFLYSFGG